MDIKNKLKLIIAIDILAVGILSLLLNEWRLCLIPLFAIFMIWFLATGENKTKKIYKLTVLASIGFIEGCLVVFDVVHNSIDIHIPIMGFLCILIGLGVLYFSKYVPKHPIEDEFMEHIAEKSGHFAFVSATCLMITICVFLLILSLSSKTTYGVEVREYTIEIMLLIVFNFAMFRNYLFKKYLS